MSVKTVKPQCARHFRFIAIICCMFVVTSGGSLLTFCAAGSEIKQAISNTEITRISKAEFVLIAGAEIPRSDAWQSLSLTDHWPIERYASGREGWYRITLELQRLPQERFAIYLRRLNMNAEIFLNGSLVASGGQFSEPLTRNWNFPMYAETPPALWREGENTIHIRHISYRGYGYISPLYLGPARLLRGEYELAVLMQLQIARYLFPVVLVTGLFIFFIWLRRRKEPIYLWFAVATAAWSVYIVNMFVRQLIMPTRLWEWIVHFSIELWVVAFLVFSYRFAALKLGKLSWVLIAYLLTAAIAYAAGDMYQLKNTVILFHGISLTLGFALALRLALQWRHSRNTSLLALSFGTLVLCATGVHDWMFQTGLVNVTGTLSLHLHYYCAPLVFTFIAWHLTSRYSSAVDELENMNLLLEQRISGAEQELTLRFEQIRAMEQREAVLQERDRIAREIHDTIGGRFSSAIMVTDLMQQKEQKEQSGTRASRSGRSGRVDVLRKILTDGLTEVRHLVTAMVGDISNSADLIYYIVDKTGATLASVDIGLHSDFELARKAWPVSNSEALNVVRVFQEATNNIIKHSGAGHVTLTASDCKHLLSISIRDGGVGLKSVGMTVGVTPGMKGYGIKGMKKRCQEIRATFSIKTEESGGCVVSLTLAESP